MAKKTKTVKIRFSVTFEATLEVPTKATTKDIGEAAADIDIPENSQCEYVPDTFDVETDENGDPELF